MDMSGKIAIPVGIIFAFLVAITSGILSWARGDRHTNMLETADERQKQMQDCLATLATNSTKEVTLLEQIANSLQRR